MIETRNSHIARLFTLVTICVAMAVGGSVMAAPRGKAPVMSDGTPLACRASSGDVVHTVRITNTTRKTLKKGTRVHWTLKGNAKTIKRSTKLTKSVAPGGKFQEVVPMNEVGVNAHSCTAKIPKTTTMRPYRR